MSAMSSTGDSGVSAMSSNPVNCAPCAATPFGCRPVACDTTEASAGKKWGMCRYGITVECATGAKSITAAYGAMAVAMSPRSSERQTYVADEVIEALAQQRVIRVGLEAEAGEVVGRPRQGRRQRHAGAEPAGVRQRLPLQPHHLGIPSKQPVT